MEERLRAGLRTALRSRDAVAIAALRSALGALDNATAVPVGGSAGAGPVGESAGAGPAGESARAGPVGESARAGPVGDEHFAGSAVGLGAAEVPRRQLTPAESLAVVRAEIAERHSAAGQYGPGPAADRLRVEAAVLESYLD